MSPLELDQLVREIGDEVQRRLGGPAVSVPACACGAPATKGPRAGRIARDPVSSRAEVGATINQMLLRPDTTAGQVRQLCGEARQFGFASVCVTPPWVSLAVRELRGTKARVAAVIGYPHGTTLTPVKLAEAEQVLKLGACELEMVIHPGALNSGQLDEVYSEIRLFTQQARGADAKAKVVVEMALLAEEQKVMACALARLGGADMLKTSADQGGVVAADDVALAHRIIGGELGIEAAGGIDSHARLREMMNAGATRVGTSAGAAIMNEALHG